MSRWSTEPLRIALAPGEVALQGGRGTQDIAIPERRAPERRAAGLLPLLNQALADSTWRGRRVEVVLSQHFVRHVLTPAPGKALSRAEERALVGASFREIYDSALDLWQIQVHSQPPRHGLVGAAIDAPFVQQLDALLTEHGFREIAIRPLASVAARRLPKRFTGWWILAEPGWLSLFAADHGIWQYVSGLPADQDWAAALPDLLDREAASAGLPPPSMVWLQGAGVGPVTAPPSARIPWQVLPHDPKARGALAWAAL